MSTAKSILGIVPGLQAAALVGANLKGMNYYLTPRKGKKKRNMAGGMVRMGVGNLIAIPLIGATAGMVNAMD
jgi:hypothetical protein